MTEKRTIFQQIKRIGILAGGGNLPISLIQILKENTIPFSVIGLKDHYEPDLLRTVTSDQWAEFRIGAVGKILKFIHQNQISHLVFAGHVKRPSLAELRPDTQAMKILLKTGAMAMGDDQLLSAIARYLEDQKGLKIISATDILTLADDSLHSIKTKCQPDKGAWEDIKKGASILTSLSAHDIGQSVIVQQGIVLGIEAIEGTDALILRSGKLARKGQGGVLVKLQKEQQSQKFDVPTIGPDTIENASDAGLVGIAIDKRGMIVLQPEKVVSRADALGLFLVEIAPASQET